MNRINEIGDTPKGQDALGQVHGRAIKRRQMLGDKGAISRKLDNTARDAQHKAYTQGKKHGFDIYDPNGSFDKGVSKGYQKAKTNESTLQKIVKDVVNKTIKESDELDANDWKARYLKNAHYPNEPVDMKDIENKASWEAFDDNVNSHYGQRGCYDDDYASQAYADDPLSDFYGLENKNTYDLKGYLAKRKLNKLTKNESMDINKKLIKLTENDLHRIVKESVTRIIKEGARPASMEEIDRNLVNKAIGAFMQFYGERPTLQDYNINDDGRIHLTLKSKHCFQAMYFDTKGNRQTDFREVDWDPYSWKKEGMQSQDQI